MTDAAMLTEPSLPPEARAPTRVRVDRARTLASLPLVALALALALVGQRLLADRTLPWDGAILFTIALVLWLRALALARPLWSEPPLWRAEAESAPRALASSSYLPLALTSAALAWLLLTTESFTSSGVLAWLASVALLACAVVPPRIAPLGRARTLISTWPADGWQIRISVQHLLLVGVVLVAVFFRFYQLSSVPAEVTSDHIEKLLDVRDVLQGKAPLFFPRNTGREPLEFYLAATVARLSGLQHLTLQLVTITVSLLAVVTTYFLGKELLPGPYGLLAAALMAVSRWDVGLARLGLRFSLSTLFVALTLLFLLRALRTQRPGQYLLAGLSLGLGLLGYSNFRVVPVLVVVLGLLALVLRGGPGIRRWRSTLTGLSVLGVAAGLVALPLARYSAAHPDNVWYRALTRVGSLERPLPDDPLVIFMQNLRDALLMFNWRGDNAWFHNVGFAPALDQVTAALFALGVGYLVVRLLRRREFWAAALLVSVPVLLLPSALSIAFPIEVPSFNRGGVSIPVVYLIAALVPGMVWQLVRRVVPGSWGTVAGVGVLLALLVPAASENYSLYFGDYARQYRQSVPNSSEIGSVAAGYADVLGGRERVYMLSYPHWVDARAVGLHMGDITWDAAHLFMQPEQIVQRGLPSGNLVYLLHPSDAKGLAELQRLYPGGHALLHRSSVPGRDFVAYLVLDEASNERGSAASG